LPADLNYEGISPLFYMNKGIINGNFLWLIISFGISFLYQSSTYKEDSLAKNVCTALPYEASYHKRKISKEDVFDNKVDLSKINNPGLTLEEIAIEDYCFEVFDRFKILNSRDIPYKVVELWAIMFFFGYVLKYKTK